MYNRCTFISLLMRICLIPTNDLIFLLDFSQIAGNHLSSLYAAKALVHTWISDLPAEFFEPFKV